METVSRREKEKQMREAEIITAAEKIFYSKGFEAASMDEVAKEAQFTKRTVYQYFLNKEDLFWAVAFKGFKLLISYFESAIAEGTTGFDKIHRSGLAYYRFFKECPDTFRIINYCRFINTGEQISPSHQGMHQLESHMYQMFIQAIEEGQKDGSIRTDLDTTKGAYFVVSVSIGLLNLLSETSQVFEQHYAMDQQEFILLSLDLLCDAIRARG